MFLLINYTELAFSAVCQMRENVKVRAKKQASLELLVLRSDLLAKNGNWSTKTGSVFTFFN